jgi:hypothetical protein
VWEIQYLTSNLFPKYLAPLTCFNCCCTVFKWNHDKDYNDELPRDGIQHVYIDRFESVNEDNKKLEIFLNEHGCKCELFHQKISSFLMS